MVDLVELIAEPNRRKILQIVWNREYAAGDIARQFDVSFGAISQHLHRLRDAGLVEMRKAGRTHYYRARKEALGPFAKALEAMWSDALDRLKLAAESEVVFPIDKLRPRGRSIRKSPQASQRKGKSQ
jgi:DNA-binding transcriptional ArsR family regulator